tara:strand:+ start:210553 stop:211995 length:1443 start_codon:yes stop_codon:yes gene_type:complete
MIFQIDIATLTSVSSVFYSILLVLLFLFWRQNKDIDAILWWCGFPLFRIIYSLISSDSINYGNDLIIYIGNLSVILSDTMLMIGCLKFTNMDIRWKIIYGYLAVFIAFSFYQYFSGTDLAGRTKLVVIIDLIPIMASIYALSHLENKAYAIEKYFTIFWISFQIAIFTFWILINFNFSSPTLGPSIIISLAFAYLGHIFITVGLIILTIAQRRNQLLSESLKHKELERNLERVLEVAQAANEEKNLFLTNMSHELRTPLNAIIGFSESLKLKYYGELNEKQYEYVDNIYGGGELLLKLITDLLHLSNIEEGKVDIFLEDVNLNDLLTKTLPLLQEIVGKDSDRLKINNQISNTEIATTVYIDQIRTKQILINFVSNAVKYSENDKEVLLELVDYDDDYYRISITDHGVGIEEDQYENIFLPFNRAGIDTTTTEGIGVGLSIAKNLIEEMKGRVDFVSKFGEGSTFWIDIPKSKQRQLPIS